MPRVEGGVLASDSAPRPSRRRRMHHGRALLAMALVVISLGPASVTLPGGHWTAWGLPMAAPIASPLPAATDHPNGFAGLFTLSGTLSAYGDPPAPLNGVNVTVSSQTCTGEPSPTSCPNLATQPTSDGGAFAFSLSNGSYFLSSVNTSHWGGGWSAVTIAGAAVVISLLVYPWVPYGNVTEILPAWNNLSAYAANCNAQTPCLNTTYGSQIPLLAWTQDGVFYVNQTDELVFYSFVTHSVTPIAAWVPLYQNVMIYDGMEDTEWITVDGSYVYTVGCLSLCIGTSAITVYGANVSTGTTFEYNFTGVTRSALENNAQLDLIGLDGNHSTAALIESNGVIRAYNIWNRTQWTLATLSYFEANNAYWIPQLNSYIDVQAQGSSLDNLEQYQLAGAGSGATLTVAYSGTYAQSYKSNGVDGLYLNLTARQLVVTESTKSGSLATQVFAWNDEGVLTGEVRGYSGTALGSWPNATALPNSITSEHRPGLASQTPMLMGYWDGFFDNDSWLYEPQSGSYFATNVSMSAPLSTGTYRQASIPPSAVENLFFNTTYEILDQSVNCRQTDSYCPLEGTADGAGLGTVWWSWRLGAPEFPFPSTAPLAQTTPPGPVTNLAAAPLSNSLRITWTPPSTGIYPLLNYTVFWSANGSGANESATVPAGADGYVIRGLNPLTVVRYQVWAWNLHWHGAGGNGSVETLARPDLIQNFTTDPTLLDLEMPLTVLTTVVSSLPDPAISYSDLPAGCVSENTTVLICQPTESGRFQLEVIVANPLNETDIAFTNVTINPELSPVTVRGPSDWDANAPVNLSVSVSGSGTPPYTYAWHFDDGSNATGGSVQHVFTVPGAHVVDATATDRLGEVQNGSLLIEIHPTLSVTLTATPEPVAIGAPVNVSASVGDTGTGPFEYLWNPTGLGPGTTYQTLVFHSLGTGEVTVTVIDAAGSTDSAALAIPVVVAPVTATFTAASGGVTDVGVPIQLTLTASGGTPPYAVALSGAPFTCSSSDETHWACDPTMAGNFVVQASLRDSLGLTGAAVLTLTVHARPVASLVASTTAPVLPGDSVDWLVAVTGGTAPFEFVFTRLPPGCDASLAGGANLTCVPSRAGTFPVSVSVTDAFAVVSNASTTLTVSPVPVIPQTFHTRPLPGGRAPGALVDWLVPVAVAGATAAALAWGMRPTPKAPLPGKRPASGRRQAAK